MRLRIFLFRLAILNTFKRRFRATLAIGGIGLSTGIMVVLFGIGNGLQSLVTREVSGSDARDVVTVNQRNAQAIRLDQERISKIRSMSGVATVEQSVGLVGELSYHGIKINMPVYAVSSGYFESTPTQLLAGEIRNQPQGANIVISKKAAEALSLSSNAAIGKQASLAVDIAPDYSAKQTSTTRTLKPVTYTVRGVIEKDDIPAVYMPLEQVFEQGVGSVSQLKVRVTNPDKIASVREAIEQMGLQTTSIQDSIDQVDRIFQVIQRILLVFGFVTLVVTVFGTFTVITLTLVEETKQIGFLRIMGLQKHQVGFLFTAQAIMLTVSGALLGCFGGLVIGFVANGLTRALVGDTIFSQQVYVFQIPAFQIILMLMLSAALGWLIGIMPAKRAILIGPLEELKE
jgi:putative ABC transport system permease protein